MAKNTITLTDGTRSSNLFVIKYSMKLESNVQQVKAYNSTWFTAKTPNMGAITLSFLQPSVLAQNATVGLIQEWCQSNQILDFSYPNMGIEDWKVYITQAPYTWDYTQPCPACNISMTSVTNWYQPTETGIPSPSSIWSLLGNGIVTKSLSQVENEANKVNGAKVSQWIASKQQFHGLYIDYLSSGNITVWFSNGQCLSNVKPNYAIYQQILQYQQNHLFQAIGTTPTVTTYKPPAPVRQAHESNKQNEGNGNYETNSNGSNSGPKWWQDLTHWWAGMTHDLTRGSHYHYDPIA